MHSDAAIECAARAAERLRRAIADHFFVGTPPFAVSVSVGCASLVCLKDKTSNELIHLAESRLRLG